ncbi:glutamate--tRNA ligase [Parasphaerochaeta coccoides]|uniref:Glutamate--tRNA ligase n=1 Tax=Parasphaerochaeta coccoides (strain ATCC BAA-1237 / DSM 17374 / SPN1) TaxID=760011 RepID=F4GJE1_PARC1|nr:glutamate--tRNA ligase [Parasphaerochaeta coccoides]AEC02206.1 glutamyl-tRNA synthetase [Parasphaerochaeta coccoides DSM 17374]
MQVRVRYAPSPTGLQHIGGVRTALFNYFFARANGGKFILRIEDTDRERSTVEALHDLYDTLDWLGITWDEGPQVGGPYDPYIQSERYAVYREYARKLVEDGKAYYCYCTAERLEQVREEQQATKSPYQGYDRHCRDLTPEERARKEAEGVSPVIRLKVPLEGSTTFHDVLMGDITRMNKDVNPDPVLLKSDGFPTYHLANVIDDHLMGITHIMRAQEWIPSGPLHILLYEAFDWEPPIYCHLPMVMGNDGHKLSKRHGSTSVKDFREKGYLPEALMNYVSMVGWSYDGQREFFSKDELEKVFSLEKITKSPGVFDYKKLDWYNGHYIRLKGDAELASLLEPYLQQSGCIGTPPTETEQRKVLEIVPLVKERLKVLSDVVPMTSFIFSDPGFPAVADLLPKKQDAEQTLEVLGQAYGILRSMVEAGSPYEEIESHLAAFAGEAGVKVNGVFQPIRVAVTGSTVSPPLFDSIRVLGAETSFSRIERAIDILKQEVCANG